MPRTSSWWNWSLGWTLGCVIVDPTSRGKGEVVPVEEDVPDILGSPIVLPPTISAGSSSSYLALPIVNELSSIKVEESLVSPLVLMNNEDKENEPHPGIGVVNAYCCFEALQGGSMDASSFVRETRAVLQEYSGDMIAVCGQCAFRSQGPPNSRFNPYTSIRRHLCPGRQFLFHLSRAHRHTLGAEGVLPGRYIESFLRVFKQFTHT